MNIYLAAHIIFFLFLKKILIGSYSRDIFERLHLYTFIQSSTRIPTMYNVIQNKMSYVNCVGVSLQLYYDVAIVEGYGRKLTHNFLIAFNVYSRRENILRKKNMFHSFCSAHKNNMYQCNISGCSYCSV